MQGRTTSDMYPWLWAQDGRPRVYGHRGAPRAHPENSIPGLLAALDNGADGVELDVRVSRDHVPVVSHDPTLRRTHGENIPINSQPARHLPVPRLDETLTAIRQAHPKRHLDIELKEPYPPDRLLELLDRLGGTDGVTVTSFDGAIVDTYRKETGLAVGLLVDDRRLLAKEASTLVDRHDPHVVGVRNPVFLGSLSDTLHDVGRALWVWTLNRRAHMQRAVRFGADAIITDLPGTAVNLLDGKGTQPVPGL